MGHAENGGDGCAEPHDGFHNARHSDLASALHYSRALRNPRPLPRSHDGRRGDPPRISHRGSRGDGVRCPPLVAAESFTRTKMILRLKRYFFSVSPRYLAVKNYLRRRRISLFLFRVLSSRLSRFVRLFSRAVYFFPNLPFAESPQSGEWRALPMP